MEARRTHSSLKSVRFLIAYVVYLPPDLTRIQTISDKIVPLPSVFFIGENGAVLEIIIDSSLSLDDLFAKINTILVKSGRLSVSAATAHLLSAELATSNTSSDAGSAIAPTTSSTSISVATDEERERQQATALQKAKEAIERLRKEKEAETAKVRE